MEKIQRSPAKWGMLVLILPLALLGWPTSPVAQADDALVPQTQATSVTTNLGIFGGDTWDIAVDGNHVYTIASGVPNGFFYSTDGAASWQRPAGANDYGSGTAVEVDPTTHAVYVALGGDLYKSTDYGATLTKIAHNMGNVLLFAQGKLFASYNDSISVSSDGGATFTTVPVSGENVMSFAATATAGTFFATAQNAANQSLLLVSTNSGASWADLSHGGPTTFSQVNADPYNANIFSLSDDNSMWLTTNNGLSWTDIGTTASRACGDYSTWTSTGRWYACAGYSTNNGASWTDSDMHTNVMRGPGKIVTFDPSTPTTMYGDCMSGVCKSIDGGVTWSNSLNGITGVNVLAISQTTNKSTVWIASSNGLGKTTNFTDTSPTWTWPILPCDTNPGGRCDSSGIGESVWVKPDNANIVLAGSIGGWVYRSTDGGVTWDSQVPAVVNTAKFKTGSWNNLRPQHFINDPKNTSIVYLAMVDPVDHNGAVLKSTDAGATWTDLNITNDAPARNLSMSTTGVLYVGTGEGKSTANIKGIFTYQGGTWTKLSGIDSRLNITTVLVDPEVQTTVYATASNDLAPLQLDGFFRSMDSGVTWTKVVPAGFSGFDALTVQKSTSPNTLYMSARDNANHGILLKSSDQGATWGVLYTGLKAERFTTALFDGLLAGNKHGIFSIKSRAAITLSASKTKVRKNSTITLSGTLKDAVTKKVFKNSTVTIQKLIGKTWKTQAVIKTNTKGQYALRVKIVSSRQFRLAWTPSVKSRAEYTDGKSRTITVNVTSR